MNCPICKGPMVPYIVNWFCPNDCDKIVDVWKEPHVNLWLHNDTCKGFYGKLLIPIAKQYLFSAFSIGKEYKRWIVISGDYDISEWAPGNALWVLSAITACRLIEVDESITYK